MPKVKVMVKNNQAKVRVPVGIRLLIRRCCQAVLVSEHFKQDAEVSVSFVSDEEIRRLNRIYRKKDRVTDVLSFPLGQNGHYRAANLRNGMRRPDFDVQRSERLATAGSTNASKKRANAVMPPTTVTTPSTARPCYWFILSTILQQIFSIISYFCPKSNIFFVADSIAKIPNT